MNRRLNTATTPRRRLSPVQLLKGYIIRLGFAKKVRAKDGKKRLNRDGRESTIQFQFIWHRVALLFVSLIVMGWVSVATAGYFFVKHARDFPEVRYVDIFFPHRWDHYRTARGDYYINQAQEKLEAGDWDGVLHLLRVGVQQSPENKEGRLLLAQIYSGIGRPELGITLLKDRAEQHGDDTEYLGMLISLLFANHDDATVEELADRLLAGSTEPTERNLVLAVASATANFNRGNYDRAEQIIEAFDLLQSRTGMLLQARIDWEVGLPEKAIERLELIMTNPGPQEAQVVDYLIEYLWSSGRHSRAEQVAMGRYIADPLSYQPKVRLLYIHDKRGAAARVESEIENFFRLFGMEEEAMQALAQFAARNGKPRLAERVLDHSRRQGHSLAWPTLFLIEAQVAAGDHREALDFFQSIAENVADWTPLQQSRLKPLQAVAHFGVGEVERGEALITDILSQRNTSMVDLTTLSERLVEVGEFARARQILQHIHQTQPLNQEALTRLIRLDLEQGNNREIVPNLQRLLEMRKPSMALLEDAKRHISSDRFMFQQRRTEILESLDRAMSERPGRAS